MIRFVSGDLLKSTHRYVAEGNQEGLGTGLALKITQKWPDVQVAFKRYARLGRFRGGEIWACPPKPGRPGVIYLATQPNMHHARLAYLRKAIKRLAKWADRESVFDVGLPKIGSGLGKLSWQAEVKPLLLECLSEAKCLFTVYEDFALTEEECAEKR